MPWPLLTCTTLIESVEVVDWSSVSVVVELDVGCVDELDTSVDSEVLAVFKDVGDGPVVMVITPLPLRRCPVELLLVGYVLYDYLCM
jgi:hypothetical protein